MADIKERCSKCDGTGVYPFNTEASGTCDQCEGTGLFVSKVVDTTDIEDKLNDIFNKCDDILEKLG